LNLETILRWLAALPALLLPGFGHGTQTTEVKQSTSRTVVQAPATTPAPAPTPKAAAKVTVAPKPTAAPVARPISTPAATTAASEIASEQVCPGQSDVAKTSSVLVCMTSQARVFNKLGPVSANSALMAAAAAKNQDMLSCGYGHTACGRSFNYWISAKGYTGRCSAENIAMGQRTPRDVFVAWMNSAGHRANILNANYRDLGVAQLPSPKGPLWTMQLGGC
jgi:uncharacterized protein YkwD